MWQQLSLRGRVNLLLAVVLALGLAINVGRQVADAGPRVRAEDQSVIHLAREFIDTIVAGLNEAPDPETRLNQIVHDLNRLRHVSISRQGVAGEGPADIGRSGNPDEGRLPPAWFVALVHPEKTMVTVPISIRGKPGALLITSHPDDEIAEIWDGIVTQLLIGSCVALALFLITSFVVGRALAPISALSQAITKIEAGSYDTRVKVEGSPELAAICEKVNHLAAALGTAVGDKQRLAERVVSLQDVERKEIARELHDEFGQILTAIGSMLGRAGNHAPEGSSLRADLREIREVAQTALDNVRGLSQTLHPSILEELGLESTIDWYLSTVEKQLGITVTYERSGTAPPIDATIGIHVYRVLQEALSNVARHSGSDRAVVRLLLNAGTLELEVEDRGKGLNPATGRQGLGLVAMRERAAIVNGTLELRRPPSGGTLVRLSVPLAVAETPAVAMRKIS